MSQSATFTAVADWLTMLDQIDASIANELEASDRRRQFADELDEPICGFDEHVLGDIDERLRGFEDRLSGVRALADQIEAALETDERAVIEYRESAATARKRPAPTRQLS